MAERTREKQIKSLRRNIFAVYIIVPLLFLVVLGIKLLGYPIAVLPIFILCLLAILGGAVHRFFISRGQMVNVFHYSLVIFLALVETIGIHLTGGVVSPFAWLYILSISIEGTFFSLRRSLFAAACSGIFFSGLILLENYGWLTAVPIFLNLNPYSSTPFVLAVVIAYLFLFFAIAGITGYSGDVLRQEQQEIIKGREELKKYARELENSRLALLNTMEDLDRVKSRLELRVDERTAELEEAKAQLETKVAERTSELEKARKAVLHMLKDLKEDMIKLQAVDRMKTEFLSMVSHELRTPITPIKGYLSLLLEGKMGKLSKTQVKVLKTLQKQGEHLQNLIDSLLDISRLELGKPIPAEMSPLSPEKIIEDVIDAIKIQAGDRGFKIKLAIEKALPTIMGDDIKLKRVLTNLIGNSIKFTPKGGEIKIVAFAEKSSVRIEVIDNGIGIAREYLEKIFDKFFQVDSSYTRAAGGIGMGLAIAKELVEVHGGKIWAESDGPGKGTKFIFTLPIIRKGGKQNAKKNSTH